MKTEEETESMLQEIRDAHKDIIGEPVLGDKPMTSEATNIRARIGTLLWVLGREDESIRGIFEHQTIPDVIIKVTQKEAVKIKELLGREL